MDEDDLFAGRAADPLTLLRREDLDPLSQDELGARIETLKAEIARVEAHRARAASHRSAADELFRKG